MGVGDGARVVPRGADPWRREQKSVAGVKEWDMLQLVPKLRTSALFHKAFMTAKCSL